MDFVFPSSLRLNGSLFNRREGASIVTRQRVCVCVFVRVCPPTEYVLPAYVELVYVVLSAEEASLVLFLAACYSGARRVWSGFPLKSVCRHPPSSDRPPSPLPHLHPSLSSFL